MTINIKLSNNMEKSYLNEYEKINEIVIEIKLYKESNKHINK